MSEFDLIPEADPEGFVNDVENNYTEERLGSVKRTWHKDIPRVAVISGEYPEYSRFVKDMRKYLFRHGFVLWHAQKDVIIGVEDGEKTERRHKIVGIPVSWVIAEMNGYTCNTGSCMKLATWDSQFCEKCQEIGIDRDDDGNVETLYT